MSELAIQKDVTGTVDEVCNRVTEAIKTVGFGVLTRIDFDKKIKEKLGETIRPCAILGACNPRLAYEAYKESSDVALLIPCNIAVTELADGKVRIEAMRPTQMLRMLPEVGHSDMIEKAEADLQNALNGLSF